MAKALILAAGVGTRLQPVTTHCHKVMIPFAGQPFLAHTLRNLVGLVEECVIVVGYRREDLRRYFGAEFGGMPMRYVEQAVARGTADAILAARPALGAGPSLVVLGDVYCSRALAQAMLAQEGAAALALCRVADPQNHKAIRCTDGRVTAVGGPGPWVDMGIWLLHPSAWQHLPQAPGSDGESRFLAGIAPMLRARLAVRGVPATQPWIQLGDHDGVRSVDRALRFFNRCLPSTGPEPDWVQVHRVNSRFHHSVVFGGGSAEGCVLNRSLVYCRSRMHGVEASEAVLAYP